MFAAGVENVVRRDLATPTDRANGLQLPAQATRSPAKGISRKPAGRRCCVVRRRAVRHRSYLRAPGNVPEVKSEFETMISQWIAGRKAQGCGRGFSSGLDLSTLLMW